MSDSPVRVDGLTALARRLGAFSGWRRGAIAFLAGSLSVLAFAPVHAFPILFATLPVLVWLIDSSDGSKAAARDGWWFGFGYFLFNLFWIGEAFLVEADRFAWALPFAVTLLPASLALFFAAAAAISRSVWTTGLWRIVTLALSLALADWLRGHILSGLPWNIFGYALTYPLPLMQVTALIGVYALTPIAIIAFTAPAVIWADTAIATTRSKILAIVALTVLPLASMAAYGSWRLAHAEDGFVPNVRLRLVQPSIPQREKWQPEHQRSIFETHLRLSQTSPDGSVKGLDGITHVLWPEAAMPFLPLEHPEALAAIGELLPQGTVLLSGALRRTAVRPDGTPYPPGEQPGFNSLMAFDATGQLIATYDKTHLVPFGEYLPLNGVLSAIGLQKLTRGLGAFATGPEPRPLLQVPGLPEVGPLICYEALFPGGVVQSAARPGVLVNVTNDGWFGDTSGPRQHFHQTRVRAVEEGLPLVRVANNGISAVIDSYGRIVGRIDLNVQAALDSPLPVALPPPPYVRFRDGSFWLLAAAMSLLLMATRRARRY